MLKILLASGCIALVHCSGGETESTGASGDDVTASYTLLVSASSARTSAVSLNGAVLSGNEYIFTSDATKSASPSGITQVRYYLDDTAMSGTPTHVENVTAYDFVGTGDNDIAEPWDTTKIANGSHTITESVTTTSGAIQSSTATFTIGKATTPPTDAGTTGPASCPSTATLLSSFGSAGSGGDDTAIFQNAINSTAKAKEVLRVKVGAKAYILGPISIPSNANICFDSGVNVTARAGYAATQVMFSIENASNVQLLGYGATFTMPTSEWSSDPDPEYRHFLAIVGSSTVHIAGVTANTFGGDGLYLSGNSSSVNVEDFTSNGHARDGLTVISAKDTYLRRLHLNGGHTGVDMEPNEPTDSIVNVHLEDSETVSNNYGGLNIAVYAYTSSSTPPTITILRHSDRFTANKATTDFHPGTSYSLSGTNGVALGGSILFDTCTSVSAGSRGAWAAWWTSNGPSATFKNLTITNPNQNGTAVDGAAVAVGRGGGGEGNQGNVLFTGTNVSSTDHKIDYYFTFYDGSNFGFTNAKFISPGTLSGATKAPPDGLLNGVGVSTVND